MLWDRKIGLRFYKCVQVSSLFLGKLLNETIGNVEQTGWVIDEKYFVSESIGVVFNYNTRWSSLC